MKIRATTMDRNHASSFDYALGTLYKMAGKMLKLVFQQSLKLLGFLALALPGRSQMSFNVTSTLTKQHDFVTCRGSHRDNLGFGERISEAGERTDKGATAAAGV